MRQRTNDLIKQGDKLFADRTPILSLWQVLCENFHVLRADYTRMRFLSEEFASYLMTGRPAMAHRDLTNLIPALMRPRDRQWLWARTNDEGINEDREARGYLDWMSRMQFRAMYDRRAMLVRSCKEADGDFSSVGNAVLTVEVNQWRDGLLVRCWHPRDVVWTESHALSIDSIHHKVKESVRDLCKRFPKTAPEQLTTLLKDEPNRMIDCRRIAVPTKEYDLQVRNPERTPWVLIYVVPEFEAILEEKAVRTSGYVIPRWQTVSGIQYAYSPAAIYGLPDARMLQQITLTMLEVAQKAADPPLTATFEAIQGGINTGAGMITWKDPDYDERTGPALEHLIAEPTGIQYGAAREEKIDHLLDATFFLNQLRMPQVTKDMTAYEASKLYEEFQRSSLPLLEPIESEYNGALSNECYEQLQGIGYFGSPQDVPEALQGQDLRWDFDTPLKAATEQAKVFAFSQTVDVAVKGAQADPDVLLEVDWSKGTREAVIGAGGADWLLTKEKVEAVKKQREQQRQAQESAQAMAQGADVASRVGAAMESAGKATQAMQGAGMV